MSFLKYKLNVVILLGIILGIFSCTSSDEYLKFVKDGAISYTGKIDSLKFFPGRNRAKIEGLIVSDPKVNQLRVYWNNKKDSIVIPINRTSGVNEVSTIIENLPENIYNFEVRTFDAKGNSSIAQNVTAKTYGTRYQASLTDRKIITGSLSTNLTLTIDFATMDLITGAYATEIIYTDGSNVEHTVTVPVTQNKLVIPNYKNGSSFKQRSIFKPVATSIDIFYTEFVTKVPDVIDFTYLIKNNKKPFEAEAGSPSATFVNLKDWITNTAAKPANGYGGLHTSLGYSINFETINSSTITNGKCYQTITLPAGKYNLTVVPKTGDYTTNLSSSNFAYIAVAKGATLPDSNNGTIETDPLTLGFKKIVADGTKLSTKVVSFVLTQQTVVSLGLSMTYGSGKYCVLESFSLEQSNK